MGLDLPEANRDGGEKGHRSDPVRKLRAPALRPNDDVLNTPASPERHRGNEVTPCLPRSERFPIGLNISAEVAILGIEAAVILRDGTHILESYPLRTKTEADRAKPLKFENDSCNVAVCYSGESVEIHVTERGVLAKLSRLIPGGASAESSIAIDREVGPRMRITVTGHDGKRSLLDSAK